MKLLQRLFLVPCLAPLLALLLIAVSTTRTPSRLQILLWTSNPQPIGLWMALAGVGGAGLSGLAALLLMPAAPSWLRLCAAERENIGEEERLIRWLCILVV